MSIAGLITEGVFRAAGLVPTARPAHIVPDHFSWNYTSVLNMIFLALFGLLYWAYRHRERWDGGDGYAADPVCGMHMVKANAPSSALHQGRRFYFCSDRCGERFTGDPDRYLHRPAALVPSPRHEDTTRSHESR
jgi:YHS domain-containing protein